MKISLFDCYFNFQYNVFLYSSYDTPFLPDLPRDHTQVHTSPVLSPFFLLNFQPNFASYSDFVLCIIFYINVISEVFHIRAHCSISRKSRAVFRAKRWCVVSLAGILRVFTATAKSFARFSNQYGPETC